MEGLLFITLNKEPSCYHIDQLDNVINAGGNLFKAIENENYSGFYDWLRNEAEEIIGVRYTRLEGFHSTITKALNKLSYIKFTHEKIIEIYFQPKHDYKEDASNDQDIGICKLFIADNTYAILLDILYLTNEEFASIRIKS